MKKAFPVITKSLFCALNVAMLTWACVYMKDMPRGVLLGVIVLFATCLVVIPGIDSRRHETVYKTFIIISVFAALCFVGFVILDSKGWISSFSDFDALTEFIRGTRQWGMIIYVALVIFQVILLPIPSAVIALIGTALYGPTYAFILMTLGTLVGSVVTFMLGKVFGKKLVNWVIGEEKTKKYADLLVDKGRFLFVVMMLFPFFPDDMICLVAGITNMTYKYFITVVTLTRPVMIAFICYFGSGSIIPFGGWGIPVWIALFVGTIVLFFVMGKIKNKITGKHYQRKRSNKTAQKKAQ